MSKMKFERDKKCNFLTIFFSNKNFKQCKDFYAVLKIHVCYILLNLNSKRTLHDYYIIELLESVTSYFKYLYNFNFTSHASKNNLFFVIRLSMLISIVFGVASPFFIKFQQCFTAISYAKAEIYFAKV